jgi:TRAP-type C4-dicarboxylate transport system substrate-binding protein
MRDMMRGPRLALLAAACALAAVAAPAAAQDKPVTLRFANWLPPQHPLQQAFAMWGKSVEQASGGTIKTQVFPAQQLGQAKDHYDMARDGIADMAWINPGYQPGRFPVIAAAEIPFMLANAKSGSAAVDAWYRKYAPAEMADVKVCLTHLHSPGTFHGKTKVSRPDDLKGMKVRSANATIGRLVTLAGGTNVQVTAPEAREAMERGVADLITFPWDSILIFGIDKAAKFHMDAPLYVTVFNWVINKGVYERMSAAQKKAVDDHCTSEWAEKVAAGWAEREDQGRDKIKALAGHTVYEIGPADLEAWRKLAEALTREWAADVEKRGLKAEAVLEELKSEAHKRNAAAF